MKKPSKKSFTKKQQPTVGKSSETDKYKLPAELKRLEGKSPLQILEISAPNTEPDCAAGLGSGLGLDYEFPIPAWVKKASKQFWSYHFGKSTDMMGQSLQPWGAIARLVEQSSNALRGKPREHMDPLDIAIQTLGRPAIDLIEKWARSESPDKTAQFFVGRVRGDAAFEKIENPQLLSMVKRAPIYFNIAYCWKKFETFKSYAEAERWLRKEKVIGNNVSSREVSAVLASVGVPCRAKPGRPRKQKS